MRPPEVQFYWHDQELEERVAERVRACWREGGAAALIATRAHLAGIQRRLPHAGHSLPLAGYEAAQWLRATPRRIREVLAPSARSGSRPLFVFHETAALLWGDRRRQEALQWEAHWRELGRDGRIEWMSAYPMQFFAAVEDGPGFLSVCAGHTAVLPEASTPIALSTAVAMRSA